MNIEIVARLRDRLPKYIYTPDYQRAFLCLSADVRGKWSAGYVVWAGALDDELGGERSFNYGPYVNSCGSIDQAMLQLIVKYLEWEKQQG